MIFYNKYIKFIMEMGIPYEMGMLYDIKLPKISCNTINIYLCDRTVSTIDLSIDCCATVDQGAAENIGDIGIKEKPWFVP